MRIAVLQAVVQHVSFRLWVERQSYKLLDLLASAVASSLSGICDKVIISECGPVGNYASCGYCRTQLCGHMLRLALIGANDERLVA